jgi:hypothetical protein
MTKTGCPLVLSGTRDTASHGALLRLFFPLALAGCFVACSGSDPTSRRNDDAGKPCQMVHTELECTATSSLCYGVGTDSSCAGGALCVGDGSGLTCAYSCSHDSDCQLDGSAAVCMQGCKNTILNGYCVQPAVSSDLLGTTCTTGSSGNVGSAGVSG